MRSNSRSEVERSAESGPNLVALGGRCFPADQWECLRHKAIRTKGSTPHRHEPTKMAWRTKMHASCSLSAKLPRCGGLSCRPSAPRPLYEGMARLGSLDVALARLHSSFSVPTSMGGAGTG